MKGTIIALDGRWDSGLATISIKNDTTGDIDVIPADNGPLFRALGSMFGGMTPGHSYDPRAAIGKHVRYELDDEGLGILSYIGPVDPDYLED